MGGRKGEEVEVAMEVVGRGSTLKWSMRAMFGGVDLKEDFGGGGEKVDVEK